MSRQVMIAFVAATPAEIAMMVTELLAKHTGQYGEGILLQSVIPYPPVPCADIWQNTEAFNGDPTRKLVFFTQVVFLVPDGCAIDLRARVDVGSLGIIIEKAPREKVPPDTVLQ